MALWVEETGHQTDGWPVAKNGRIYCKELCWRELRIVLARVADPDEALTHPDFLCSIYSHM